jgi:hypothetical protein
MEMLRHRVLLYVHINNTCMVVANFNPSTPPNTLALQLSFKSLTVPSTGTEKSVQSINARRGKNKSVYRSSKITVSCGHNLSSCRVNLESSEVS